MALRALHLQLGLHIGKSSPLWGPNYRIGTVYIIMVPISSFCLFFWSFLQAQFRFQGFPVFYHWYLRTIGAFSVQRGFLNVHFSLRLLPGLEPVLTLKKSYNAGALRTSATAPHIRQCQYMQSYCS